MKSSEDFLLKINGINESADKQVKIVKLPIHKKQTTITAICVPEINIDITLPGLTNIARTFETKGYKLADKKLLKSERINKIDMILGNVDSNILLMKDKAVGSSVYSESPEGILLMGSVQRYKKNLVELPNQVTSNISTAPSLKIQKMKS